MNLQKDKNVLVVVGGWNPAIVLNPKWLKKYIFPAQNQFQFELEFVSSQQPLACIRVDNLVISLPGNRLCFARKTDDAAQYDVIQDIACKFADFLPHTPVEAYGVNFVFETTIGDRSFMNRDTILYKSLAAKTGNIKEEHSIYSITLAHGTLNLTAKERPMVVGGKSLQLEFNFHHEISDLGQLKAGLDETKILEHFVYARDFAQEIENQLASTAEQK